MQAIANIRTLGLITMLAAALSVPLAWAQAPLAVQEQQGISFVSGGVGKEERDQLQAMQGQFNLKLVFAIDAGNFLAGINVRIMDQQGNVLVETQTDGPILMANLPAGTYTVAAEDMNNRKEQTVTVGDQGLKEVTFTWSAG